MNVTVRKGGDPFKKYWWVILLGFGGVGAWVCLPLLGQSVGSGRAVFDRGLRPADQSLDSLGNPQGAPGQALDLSMEGTYRKKKPEGGMLSSLYQPPPEAAAPGVPIAPGAASASFAAALKEVSRKTDASGWGGAAPQKGFTPPKGNFSALSGVGGGGGGGGSGAQASLGAFGTGVAKTGLAATRGLGAPDYGPSAKGGAPVMNSLKAAQAQGLAAAGQRSADAAAALAGRGFDGGRGGSAISADQGQALGGAGMDDLDAAPKNLKPNDPNANELKYEPVPEAVAEMDTSDEMKRQLAMMLVGTLVGGLIGGPVGNAISMTMMMAAVTQGRSQKSGSEVAKQTKGKSAFHPVRRSYGPATRYS